MQCIHELGDEVLRHNRNLPNFVRFGSYPIDILEIFIPNVDERNRAKNGRYLVQVSGDLVKVSITQCILEISLFDYERYAFVPLAGLMLAFLYGVQQLLERHKLFFQRPAVMAIVLAVVLVYIVAAWRIDTNRNRDFKDNISLYTSATALSPNEVDLYYNLALSYAEAKDTPNAVSNYHAVLELEPQNYKAHNNLGSIYLASDDLIAAEREYQFAIELNPSLFSSYYNLASVYIKLNDRNRALAALDKALELNPNFTQAKQRRELLLKEDVPAR